MSHALIWFRRDLRLADNPALEAALRPEGFTLRHFPQSFELSTLGGWLATRSGGHFATGPTHLDEFVEQGLRPQMRVLEQAAGDVLGERLERVLVPVADTRLGDPVEIVADGLTVPSQMTGDR